MVSIIKVIAFAANISAHVLTLGSAKDQALFDNYLSPMQVWTGTIMGRLWTLRAEITA